MKRLLSVTLPVVFAAAIFAATPMAATTPQPTSEFSVIDGPDPGTTSNSCCWVYFYSRWWCIPCG